MPHNINFLELVEELRPQVKETTVPVIKKRLDNQENFIFIDIREDHEWKQGHISPAIHIGRGILERDIIKIVLNKHSEVVLYCGGGFRSILSAYNLQKMGYTNVVSMDGGISNWLDLGYTVTI